MLLGVAAVLALPAGLLVAHRSSVLVLLDVSWLIPVAAALGIAAVGASNLARERVQRTVGRAGGEGRARAARLLGVLGICLAVTASISVGFYELLVHFEK